jgi:hypothetical protein
MMKWSEINQEKIKRMIAQGLAYGDIASKFNTTYDAIAQAVKRYGLSKGIVKPTKVPTNVKPMKLTKQKLAQACKDVGSELYKCFTPVTLPLRTPQRSTKEREEISVLNISDTHIGAINKVFDSALGKEVETYNHKIFKKEMQVLQDSVFQIHDILSKSYKLRKLYINILGDVVTNDRIFEEQTFEIEQCVGLQIWETGLPHLTSLINNLLSKYEEIVVTCMVGNHGRSNPKMYNEPVENNFEYFLYRALQKQFEGHTRVKIIVPTTREYVVQIGPWKHLLMHGDSIRGFTPNTIQRQIEKLHMNMGGFDILDMGHFHKLQETELADKVIVKQNGGWIPKDSYSFKQFKSYSIPKQWFYGCNSRRPETWSYKVDLRK